MTIPFWLGVILFMIAFRWSAEQFGIEDFIYTWKGALTLMAIILVVAAIVESL